VAVPDGQDDAIATTVTRLAAAGRAAWPDVAVSDAQIAERLAAQLRDDPDAAAAHERLHDADLYLAIALAASEPAALRVFETTLVPQIDGALRRLRLPTGTADDVKQALRLELLVPRDGAPKITDYAGRGALAGWLVVSATRKALKLVRKHAREDSFDELLLDHWPDATPDPKTKHLRTTYTAELKTAIRDAFAALETRQRNMLRQHILDDLTIDDLARLYRVHRATCARWLADARLELGRGTRKRLIATLGLPPDDVDSLLRFLDTDIELSLSRIMHTR
jgi:RNA polymerase sigma-70 factor (ECF subfamily)